MVEKARAVEWSDHKPIVSAAGIRIAQSRFEDRILVRDRGESKENSVSTFHFQLVSFTFVLSLSFLYIRAHLLLIYESTTTKKRALTESEASR
jgi:hypothetical protein